MFKLYCRDKGGIDKKVIDVAGLDCMAHKMGLFTSLIVFLVSF